MRKLVKTFLAVTVVAWAFALPVSAATLTIVDSITVNGVTSDTTWTLAVQDGCDPCTVNLEVFFEDPDGAGSDVNGYTGTYLDAFQFQVDDPNVNPPLDADMTGGTAFGSWDTLVSSGVNANECGAGTNNGVCSEWNEATVGLLVTNDATYSWDFLVDWSAFLTVAESGNIRAAFNKANGKNFNIFSPGGGEFNTTDEIVTTTSEIVPEPTLLTLLGGGLLIAARRLRRKTT